MTNDTFHGAPIAWDLPPRQVTVREWFRILRGEQWHRADRLQDGIDRLTSLVIAGQTLKGLYESVGPIKIVFRLEEWEGRENVEALLKMKLELAMRDLEREALRQVQIEASEITK